MIFLLGFGGMGIIEVPVSNVKNFRFYIAIFEIARLGILGGSV